MFRQGFYISESPFFFVRYLNEIFSKRLATFMTLLEEEIIRHSSDQNTLITIGVFDGVHLGHQHLINELKKQAKERNLQSCLITFKDHPSKVLGQDDIKLILSLEERNLALSQMGLDQIIMLSFTPEISTVSATDFVGYLLDHLHMKGIVVGSDFALGRNRAGDATALRRLSHIMDFSVSVVSPVVIENQIVSSTAIRRALLSGNVSKARLMLGRNYHLRGTVQNGANRGTKLGFPTANLTLPGYLALPADGVYAAKAFLGEKEYNAVANIGSCPTFGQEEHRLEVHLLDFAGDIRGQVLKVEFVEFLRPEICFADAEALKTQISADISKARDILR